MERALKERIIGAVILVIFVVLVVPIFLDGPPDDEMISERVLLPGQEAQNTTTVVLDRERTEPIPAGTRQEQVELPPTNGAASDESNAEPAAAVEQAQVMLQVAPQQTPQQQPEVVAAAASATGMWAVQLGSFSSKQNAEKLAADLRKQGYAAFLSQLATNSGKLHRVRIGPQKDRESAEAMAARLQKVGHKGQVLPHP